MRNLPTLFSSLPEQGNNVYYHRARGSANPASTSKMPWNTKVANGPKWTVLLEVTIPDDSTPMPKRALQAKLFLSCNLWGQAVALYSKECSKSYNKLAYLLFGRVTRLRSSNSFKWGGLMRHCLQWINCCRQADPDKEILFEGCLALARSPTKFSRKHREEYAKQDSTASEPWLPVIMTLISGKDER